MRNKLPQYSASPANNANIAADPLVRYRANQLLYLLATKGSIREFDYGLSIPRPSPT